MQPKEFIEQNIKKELQKLGYSKAICNECARKAVHNYGRLTTAPKGGAFAELLRKAKSEAKLKQEK